MVLLASVLKPVDDTRMRGKLAETLLERAAVQVHVAGRRTMGDTVSGVAAGFDTAPAAATSRLLLHPIFAGSRLSLGRLAAQGRYWQLLRRLRPDLVVVCAPELLPLTLLWQTLGRGRKFIYDIRENYALNVTTQAVYGGWQRRLLAAGLRWVEGLAARRASAVLLAEKSYANELPFLTKLAPERVLVLENKYQPAPTVILPRPARPLPAPHEPLRLLFSGTISALNGIYESLALAKHLHQNRPGGALLTVIGCCQQPALLAELQAQAAANPAWLRLLGGATPVPHGQIVAEIGAAHFGLLPYQKHVSTWRCRPTKLFEYLVHGLPVLLPDNPLWAALTAPLHAGLIVDFDHAEKAAQTVLAVLAEAPASNPAFAAVSNAAFYPDGPATDAVLWAAEGKKLGALLDTLF